MTAGNGASGAAAAQSAKGGGVWVDCSLEP